MTKGQLLNTSQANAILARQVALCRGFFSRLKGLLGTSTLAEDEACWIIPCNSVHTVGMRYAIDVYFLNKNNEVVSVLENMAPNRFSPVIWKAHSVLEFSAGKRNLKVGDRVTLVRHCEEQKSSMSFPHALGGNPAFRSPTKPFGDDILRNHKGQTMIEFCMAFMAFMVMMFALSDVFAVCFNWATLQYASNRGIRIAKMLPYQAANKEETIRNRIVQSAHAVGISLTNDNVTVQVNPLTVQVDTVKQVTLTPVGGFLLTLGGNYNRNFTLRVREVIRNAPL